MALRKLGALCTGCILFFSSSVNSQELKGGFLPHFTVLYSPKDPDLAMRPAGIPQVNYNVATWKTYPGNVSDLPITKKNAATAGDGFDDSILEAKSSGRTVSLQHAAAEVIQVNAISSERRGDTLFYSFPNGDFFSLEAYVLVDEKPYPKLRFDFQAKREGWYAIGYTGAPAKALDEVKEIWQPLIWQEQRFPDKSYLTLAFRCPIPSALVQVDDLTIGVLASPEEFSFDPLPTMQNSRFGVAVRNDEGNAQPQLWAPVFGGKGSAMKSGDRFTFTCLLPAIEKSLTYAYECIARETFGFHAFRKNEISSLNQVIDRMTDYALSHYAWFIDSLKGCAYSTDVPGAVKNVSSLNPLNIATVKDNSRMFEERAYPTMEYMLSREKFLFSLDKEQKIQNPSRKLAGPVAPISELAALYTVFGKSNPFFLSLAEQEFGKSRIRNLDVAESSDNWINAMYLYRVSGNERYLKIATEGADQYIQERVDKKQRDFDDPFAGGYFFWPAYTNRWIELLELYEMTQNKRYLKAAHDGARHYAQFCWMSPAIPDEMITVNKGGKAPMYWYLKSKGHKQMYFPEETVPAWRLSEIGLTAESSGTSSGHRAIFMANYAPWMLRLGYYSNDMFLQELAKNAIVGRYRNFPGYHINTARTTAYEKADYPLRSHEELSVNSFHYNHIMPMISMLLDYLVTDAYVKSNGQIDFPSEYIEGYAYLQSKMYGQHPGKFEDESGVQLWMPAGLLEIDQVELNYLAARKGDKLFLAFMNQSDRAVEGQVNVNEVLVHGLMDDQRSFRITVPPAGIKTVVLEGVDIRPIIQDKLTSTAEAHGKDYLEIPTGHAKAMLFRLGDYGKRAYIYLSDDDSLLKEVRLTYKDVAGETMSIVDKSYPYEFTVPLSKTQDNLQFTLTLTDHLGKITDSGPLNLGGKELLSESKKDTLAEFHLRNGLPNFLAKASEGRPLKVGYIGGSITRAEDQYRGQTTAFLKKMFEGNTVIEVAAGVSGTDADLGACRIREQLLKEDPDIIFIEFAVNGGYEQGVEGMIRQISRYDPDIDICLIYTVRSSQLETYIGGDVPGGIQQLEKIAEHYQLPSVHLGLDVAKKVVNGEVIAKGDPSLMPNKIIFSKDGTHPLKAGGDLYAESIKRMFRALRNTPEVPRRRALPEPLHANSWTNARMLTPREAATFHGKWTKVKPNTRNGLSQYKEWFPYLIKGGRPGDSFTVKFEGNMIGLFDVGGPEAGQLAVTVDGVPAVFSTKNANRWHLSDTGEGAPVMINRFNQFCNNRHRGQYAIMELTEGRHEVTFHITKEVPDKEEILGKHQLADIHANPEKYDQNVIYLGKILLRGELID